MCRGAELEVPEPQILGVRFFTAPLAQGMDIAAPGCFARYPGGSFANPIKDLWLWKFFRLSPL